MKVNLHTHTLRCGHGHSTDEEMVLASIENGYTKLGFFKKPKGGTLGYSCDAFWEIAAEENVRAVVGIDAHAAKHFAVSDFDGAKNKLIGMGINVLDDATLV